MVSISGSSPSTPKGQSGGVAITPTTPEPQLEKLKLEKSSSGDPEFLKMTLLFFGGALLITGTAIFPPFFFIAGTILYLNEKRGNAPSLDESYKPEEEGAVRIEKSERSGASPGDIAREAAEKAKKEAKERKEAEARARVDEWRKLD